MIVIEWLMRLPGSERLSVVKKTTTNIDATSEAVELAYRMSATCRSREGHRPNGFQIVDQDGRMLSGPLFPGRGRLAA